MSLVIETGAGLSDADSYLSLIEADAYHTSHSGSTAWSGASEAAKEKALRLATQYLDLKYGRKWRGNRAVQSQALTWPRVNVYDDDGYYLLSTEIPKRVKDACAELALRVVNGDDLFADQSEPGTIGREMVQVGSIVQDISYQGGKSQTKKYPIIDGLVRPLIGREDRVERC